MRKTHSSQTMATASLSSSSSLSLRVNLYSQEMNNSAASCIEIGHYSRAIVSLTRALDLYRRQENSRDITPCNCYRCTLDGCIVHSESRESPSKNAKVIRKKGDGNSGTTPSGYIYRRPIKVVSQGHPMGPTLNLIIAFNLGLANQLLLAEVNNNKDERNKAIRGAIRAYNLTYNMQESLLQMENSRNPQVTKAGSSIWSARFQLMVLNNISELYKLNSNVSEYDNCLRRLLSIMMIVVDQQVRASTTGNNIAPMWRIDMEGFIRNTSILVLQVECTAASAWTSFQHGYGRKNHQGYLNHYPRLIRLPS